MTCVRDPYTVTFTLPGFATVRREGIELRGEFVATVNADMTVGAIEETLTVTGQAPLVDIRSSRDQTQFEGETLDALPGTGRLSMLSALIPGANLTVQTQRAGDDRAQTRFSVHGAPEAQPIVDGVNQQIVGCTIGCFVFSQLNIQEVVVESAGGGADRDFGGLQLTMVPRDGGNTFSGQAMFSYTASQFRQQQHHRRAAGPQPEPGSAGHAQEITGERRRGRRSDQARPALVLRGCPRGRDADRTRTASTGTS